LITIASKANNVTRENKEKKEKSFKEYGNIIHGSRGTPRQDTRWEPGMNKASFYKLKQGAESLPLSFLFSFYIPVFGNWASN
jgi:hypothetical protein